jgi:prevent-host-death family protein
LEKAMQTVNIRELRAQIDRLLDAVEAGEEVVIERRGKPVARLVRIAARRATVCFPDRRAFRQRIPLNRTSSAELIRALREDER